MSRTEQAADQSMEEILASIRRIISEDPGEERNRPQPSREWTRTSKPRLTGENSFADSIARALTPASRDQGFDNEHNTEITENAPRPSKERPLSIDDLLERADSNRSVEDEVFELALAPPELVQKADPTDVPTLETAETIDGELEQVQYPLDSEIDDDSEPFDLLQLEPAYADSHMFDRQNSPEAEAPLGDEFASSGASDPEPTATLATGELPTLGDAGAMNDDELFAEPDDGDDYQSVNGFATTALPRLGEADAPHAASPSPHYPRLISLPTRRAAHLSFDPLAVPEIAEAPELESSQLFEPVLPFPPTLPSFDALDEPATPSLLDTSGSGRAELGAIAAGSTATTNALVLPAAPDLPSEFGERVEIAARHLALESEVREVLTESNAAPSPAQAASTPESPTSPLSPALDDKVSDLLKPMLREWLDNNMPRLIEKALKQ